LKYEKALSVKFSPDLRFSFELRNGAVVRQYAPAYAKACHQGLNGMSERGMRQSIYAIACFWYTVWVDAGQPDLSSLTTVTFSADEVKELKALNNDWRNSAVKPRPHEPYWPFVLPDDQTNHLGYARNNNLHLLFKL
jgi:hypothetical protein